MVILGFLSWWYGAGWHRQLSRMREKIALLIDYFSIDLLLRTFLSPFRQISAGKVTGPLAVQIRAFFDRLISRIIGAMVRTVMIVTGILAISLRFILGLVWILLWAFVPLLPVIGIFMTLSGWMPWK